MAFPHDNEQDDFLYGLEWPKPITTSLVAFLVNQKSLGNWLPSLTNVPTLQLAREHINTTFNTQYTIGQLISRVRALKQRYSLFDHMISCSGVGWDQATNRLDAPIEQWMSWLQVYPRSRAYMAQGDPMYDDLNSLFALELVDEEDEVIFISDSDDEPHEDAHGIPVNGSPPAAIEIIEVSDDDALIGDEGVEVVQLSDREDDGEWDMDMDLSDFEDLSPLTSVDATTGEIINDSEVVRLHLSEDEVESPILKEVGPPDFTNVIPRYNAVPPPGFHANSCPNGPFDQMEDISGSSSSDHPSPLKLCALFK